MPNKIICGIYKIESLSGKVYIGSSINIHKRRREHFYDLSKGIHCNIHLQRDFNKHGKDYFTFSILEITSKNDLLHCEQLWINIAFSSLDRRDVYNMAPIAGNTMGRKHSEETKKKIADKALGRKRGLEVREAMSKSRKGNSYAKGYKHSSETRNKVSLAGIGRKHSEETKRRMSESAKRRYAK